MKKTYKYIALAALALGFTACTQDDDFAPQQEDIVKIASANIATEVQTRVNTLDDGTAWETGDQILLVNNSRDNKNSGTYTYNGSAWSLTKDIVLYASGTDATNSFTAYYPAKSEADYVLPTDQSTEAGVKSADRMVATTSNDIAKGAAVALNFKRQNTKITIVPEITDEYGSSATISELTITGVTPYYSTSAKDYTAIIAPTQGFEATVKVKVGDSEQTLTAPWLFEIEAGKHYTIALKVGKDVVNVNSVSVEPWTDNALTDGETKEVKVTVTTSDNTATLTIPELATDAMVQKAISNLSADITTVIIYGSLTESQQNAVATALSEKTVTLYLPQVTTASLATALQNDTDQITVVCGVAPAAAVKGDVAMLDGTFIPVAELDKMCDYLKSQASGIVFWTTADSNTSGNTPAKLTDDAVMTADFPSCTHGLIVSVKDASQSCAWQGIYEDGEQKYYESVYDTFLNTDLFTPANKSSYVAIESGTGADQNINKILGYQSTQELRAYNKYCSENPDKNDYTVQAVATLDQWAANNPAPANTTGWFLPSVKELHMLCYKDVDNVWEAYGTENIDTKNVVNGSLSKVNGEQFGSYYYWSSLEFADFSNGAFFVFFYDASVYGYYKYDTERIRAVCAY